MTEYWHEQVANALVSTFESIVGDNGTTYWYTPSVVTRFTAIETRRLIQSRFDVIYALAPFEVEITESTGLEYEETAVFDFLVAKKFHSTDEAFKHEAGNRLRWTLQTRVFGDFKRAILADVTLDGLVTNIDFRSVIFDAEDTYTAPFACVIGQIAPHHLLSQEAGTH